MSEQIPAREFRRLTNKKARKKNLGEIGAFDPNRKARKQPSPDEREAVNLDNRIHGAAKRALKAAGFDPEDGYTLERPTGVDGGVLVCVPIGGRRGPLANGAVAQARD